MSEYEPSPLEARDVFFQMNQERLGELAHSAIVRRHMKPNDFFIACIDVDDPGWTELVDMLMPNHDWQTHRERGEYPLFARGIVGSEVGEMITEAFPELTTVFTQALPEGYARAVVMGAGGASAYPIFPTPQYRWN